MIGFFVSVYTIKTSMYTRVQPYIHAYNIRSPVMYNTARKNSNFRLLSGYQVLPEICCVAYLELLLMGLPFQRFIQL